MHPLGNVLLENMRKLKSVLDCAGVYGLHVSPSREAIRATQKSKKKGNVFQVRVCLPKNTKINEKLSPKGVQMW